MHKWTHYYVLFFKARLNFWGFYDEFFVMTGFMGIIRTMSDIKDGAFMEIDNGLKHSFKKSNLRCLAAFVRHLRSLWHCN